MSILSNIKIYQPLSTLFSPKVVKNRIVVPKFLWVRIQKILFFLIEPTSYNLNSINELIPIKLVFFIIFYDTSDCLVFFRILFTEFHNITDDLLG